MNNQYNESNNKIISYDSQTGQPVYENQNNNNRSYSLDEKLLKAYVGNNYEKIIQKKFSVLAMFFSWIYTLIRKVYIPSIIGMIAIILLGFLPSVIYFIIVLTFVIVLGANFNKWYLAYAQKQIEKIKISNPNVSENELINICTKKGGTNVGLAILIYIIFVIVSNLLNPNVANIYNYFSENNLTNNKIVNDPKYKDYRFINVKTHDKSTNGNILYGQKNWIDYQESSDYNFSNSCNDNGTTRAFYYKFTINDGILTINEQFTPEQKIFTYDNIKNVKSAMTVNNGSSINPSYYVVILTNDGKIYYKNIGQCTSFNFSNSDNSFKMIESEYLYDKIGFSSYDIYRESLGVLTTTGEQFSLDLNGPAQGIKYDSNRYAYLSVGSYQGYMIINNDATINDHVVDPESNENVYINYGFAGIDNQGHSAYYLIDRQGYFYNKISTGYAEKGSKYKVSMIGIENISDTETSNKQIPQKYILVFEDDSIINLDSIANTFGIESNDNTM